ncbi:MAG TPA: DUF4838 domain-containing protein, partial [Armatimonadetes bacterium]|nr:DUF4838 domain-containing protein [Armatimonadota bacterium]
HPNYSNRFFTFANRVAEMVSRRHPNKLLGCLAYSYCQEPPSFPLHPNVIPYVTNDRAQWRDPKFKRRDMEHLRAWAKKARQLGVYDYYYGSGYVIPRVFFHISAEAIKFCHSIGVTAWYAEIYSNWALDGPKAWLASQLLWDSDQRVDELLNDYYRNFFGRAAEPMQAYFALCERQWMRQRGAGRWFKGFFDPSQLEMFPPSICMRLQSLLDRAMKLADSAIVRKRIRLYQRGLRYTTLYSTVYHLDKELTMMRIRRAKDVHRVLRMLRDFATATAQLQNYEEAIMREPLLRPVIPFRERARWSPGGNMLTALDTATAKVRRREKLNSIIAEVEAIARELRNTPLARALRAWALVQRPSSQLKQLVANPSFEERAEGVREQKGIGWSTEGVPPG